jgi:hypothetical protein
MAANYGRPIVRHVAARKTTEIGRPIKGIALGLAFVLWGGEQLLPPSRLVTVMDEGAVTIFVVDVSLIIRQHLSNTAEGNGS